MRKIVLLFVAGLLALIPAVFITAPANAGPGVYDCKDKSRTAKDTQSGAMFPTEWEWLWTARVNYQHCVHKTTPGVHHFKVYKVIGKLENLKDTNCAGIQNYKLNVTPLEGINPPAKQWECNRGQRVYKKVWKYGGHKIGPSQDKCFYMTWRVARQGMSDLHGQTNSKCLG